MRKGQVFLAGLMLAFLTFIAVVAMLPLLKQSVSDARTNLDCANTTLTAGETATCIVADWFLPGWFWGCVAVAIGYIAVKKEFFQQQ